MNRIEAAQAEIDYLDELKAEELARMQDCDQDANRRRRYLVPGLISLAVALGAAVGIWLAR